MGKQFIGNHTVRYDSGRKTFFVSFTTTDGQQIIEFLTGVQVNKANSRRRDRIEKEVKNLIGCGLFNDQEYKRLFPHGKRANLFNPNQVAGTLEEWNKKWLIAERSSYQETTYSKYEADSRIMLAYLGKYDVAELMTNTQPIFEWLKSMKGQLTKGTINNRMSVLRNTFYYISHKTDGKITYPLANRTEELRKYGIGKNAKESNYQAKPLSLAEIQKIIHVADNMKSYWVIAFLTGMRPSELHGLKWIDIDNKTIHVQRRLIKGVEAKPKTRSGDREISIIYDEVRSALAEQRKVTGFGEYVFTNPKTNKPFETKDTYNNLKFLCKRAKVQWRENGGQYITRHTFTSNMIMNGCRPDWVAKQLGHANSQTLYRNYNKEIENSLEGYTNSFAQQGGEKKAELTAGQCFLAR